ncbi:MAG TPA: glycosyltransferase family 2 protein [Vicinamibacterales bacterium]|nr:glycosyltransferase family 2 protein [Vicinamibacterales bacterium]
MSARLTVCIPAYNRPDFLRDALHSLCDQGLSREDYRVVVVDDASPVPLQGVVSDFADRLDIAYERNHRNLGHLANFERAAQLAETPWLSLLSHDDVVSPGHLGRCVSVIESRPDVSMVASLILCHRYPGAPDTRAQGLFLRRQAASYTTIYQWERAEWMALALVGTPLSMIGSVLSVAALAQCARWKTYPVWHDRMMLAEMALHGEVISLPWIGGYYRVGEGQLSHQLWANGMDEFRAASDGVLEMCAEHGIAVTDYWVTVITGAPAEDRILYLTLLHQAVARDTYLSIKGRCEEALQQRLHLGGRLDRLGLPTPLINALRSFDRRVIRRQPS